MTENQRLERRELLKRAAALAGAAYVAPILVTQAEAELLPPGYGEKCNEIPCASDDDCPRECANCNLETGRCGSCRDISCRLGSKKNGTPKCKRNGCRVCRNRRCVPKPPE